MVIVVLGVAITLIANALATRYYEQRNFKRELVALKIELKESLKQVRRIKWHYLQEEKIRAALSAGVTLPDIYENGNPLQPGLTIRIFNYSQDAYDMMKSTGSLRFITDRYLLYDIWTVYDLLEKLENADVNHVSKKESSMREGDEARMIFYEWMGNYYYRATLLEKRIEALLNTDFFKNIH